MATLGGMVVDDVSVKSSHKSYNDHGLDDTYWC